MSKREIVLSLIAAVMAMSLYFTYPASAQAPQPKLYKIGLWSLDRGGEYADVYWFETTTAECYIMDGFQGGGISCLRKQP